MSNTEKKWHTPVDVQYKHLLKQIRKHGKAKSGGKKTDTIAIFDHTLKFDLSESFPLLSLKHTHLHIAMTELMWMLSGSTNVAYLNKHGIRIWDSWADDNGEVGKMYGYSWRNIPDNDQIENLLRSITANPDSRALRVSSSMPNHQPIIGISKELNRTLLRSDIATCHGDFIIDIVGNRMSMKVHQRSCDVVVGLPYNLAFYGLLLHILAEFLDYEVGDLIWTGDHVHLYTDHTDAVDMMIGRKSARNALKLILETSPDIYSYEPRGSHVHGYMPHKAIKVTVSI